MCAFRVRYMLHITIVHIIKRDILNVGENEMNMPKRKLRKLTNYRLFCSMGITRKKA